MHIGIKYSGMLLAALLTVGCSSYGTSSTPSPTNHAWKTADSAKGQIFTDQAGKSLYTFTKDTSGVSTCYNSCAVAWPPFTASADAKPTGAWSIVSRKDGAKQWALNGMPLYYFAADKTAGDVKGDGVGGVWHLAKPGKAKAATAATNSDSNAY